MLREPGTHFDEMLTVIQHEQHLFATQIISDSIDERDGLELA